MRARDGEISTSGLCCVVAQLCLTTYPFQFSHTQRGWHTSKLQKKIIGITIDCRSRDSCRKVFFNLEILPLPSQYILSLLLFMIRNTNQFLVNSEICHTDTRQHANFHHRSVNVAKYQKGVYCLGVKVFNLLTPNDPYMGRTAPLTSKRFILYIYSTNIGTEYFKHALYSPFFLFKIQFVS